MKYLDIDGVPEWYLQKAADDTLAGLQMFVRDTNLSTEEAARYHVGDILFERGYTEATGLVGGIPTTHRFAILSNHMTDISALSMSEEVQSWKMNVAQQSARFKVLDISECRGKTQILLLHLPDNETWRLFAGIHYDIEDEYVKKSLEDFTSNCKPQVIDAVASERWLERCSVPIGFDSDGTPFSVDTIPEGRLKPIEEMNFRNIADNIVLLKSLRYGQAQEGEASPQEYPDYLAFGYIDEINGLCALLLGSARIADGTIEALDDLKGQKRTVNLSDFKNLGVIQVVDDSLQRFSDEITAVEEMHGVNLAMAHLRAMESLDHVREPLHPDIIDVRLMTKKRQLHDEQAKMMLKGIENNMIVALLLQEPDQNLGIHKGERLPLTLTRAKDGVTPVVLVEDVLAARER